MRSEYDFSRGRRLSKRVRDAMTAPAYEPERLSKARLRELRRSVRDVRNPVRFLIVSRLAPRFALYYSVTDDAYGMNDPSYATLFKRRPAALAICRQLSPGATVIRCLTRLRKGVRVPVVKRLRQTARQGKRRITGA